MELHRGFGVPGAVDVVVAQAFQNTRKTASKTMGEKVVFPCSAILLGNYKARQACILKGLVRPEAYT